MTHTREQWLIDAVSLLVEDLHLTVPVPQDMAVVHGLPDSYDEDTKKRTGGCCFDNSTLAGPPSAARIHVSPRLSDPIEVLGVLVHELVHASVGCIHDHNWLFEQPAYEIGLAGPIHATYPGPELANRLGEISAMLGTYPEVS